MTAKRKPASSKQRTRSADLATRISEAGTLLTSYAELERQLGITTKTVQRWLRALEMQGRIEKTPLKNGILKLVWSGVGPQSQRAKPRPASVPKLEVVTAPDGKTGGVVVRRDRDPRKRSEPKQMKPDPQGQTENRVDQPSPGNVQALRTASGPESRPDTRPSEVAKSYTENAPVHAHRSASGTLLRGFAVIIALLAAMFLGASIQQGILLVIEKAGGHFASVLGFAAVVIGAGLFGAVALPAAELMTVGWRWTMRGAAAACILFSTLMALGYNGHRYETTAGAKNHEASAFAALDADVKALRKEREGIGTPRDLAQIEAARKALPRTKACVKDARSITCLALYDVLRDEEARARRLPMLKGELATKEKEWRAAPPVVSADASSESIADVLNSFGEFITISGTRKSTWVFQTILGEALAAIGFAAAFAMWRRA